MLESDVPHFFPKMHLKVTFFINLSRLIHLNTHNSQQKGIHYLALYSFSLSCECLDYVGRKVCKSPLLDIYRWEKLRNYCTVVFFALR